MLAPISPHLMEEIWSRLGHDHSLTYAPWPSYDESKIKTDTYDMMIQVNGKLRGSITADVNESDDETKQAALAKDNVQKFTAGKDIKKIIVVPRKIVNIVAK